MVATLDQGVAAEKIRTVCNLSDRQIGYLIVRQARQNGGAKRDDDHGARVFEVVDPAGPQDPGGTAQMQSLELRLGPWAVSVRLAEHAGGFQFFLADNGVWLTDQVPPKFWTLSSSGSADSATTSRQFEPSR
jgi:hypothetical protein